MYIGWLYLKDYCNTIFMVFEGEYVNGERNGKGKELYGDGKIKFEGEYLNGEKNGKGKEYNYDDNLEFEGLYLYNFRLTGKEYIKERLVFEGDYLYGQKWNGKGYDENGNIDYELNNGNGKFKEYYGNGDLKFEGELVDGKRNGKGKEYNYDGKLIYYGEYLNGQRWNGKVREYKEYFNREVVSEYELLNGEKFLP